MKITLEAGPLWMFILRAESGSTRLVQRDWDFPGVARAFGWSGNHDDTSEAIWDAHQFLQSRIGESTDDPGYF